MTAQDLLAADNLVLGKKTGYDDFYNPDRLCPILRENKRKELGIMTSKLPFVGIDYWNHFEVSWLNAKGKPVVAVAEIQFPADSAYLIESKSMKLYFNSLNNTHFEDFQAVISTIKQDLEIRTKSAVNVVVTELAAVQKETILPSFSGNSLDQQDIVCDIYHVDPTLLKTESEDAEEVVFSDLLRSNCLVTGQPDWGSVQIAYTGKKINHEGLLKYIVSFRHHIEFGEHCCERIFMDLLRTCYPKKLMVHCRYTRRGGIDINCIPAIDAGDVQYQNLRLCRQ